MRIASLFDGIACGRQALERIGVKPSAYVASEIDKYAIAVAKHNWPDIIQIGPVEKPDWRKLPRVDLVMGGSPCQGFSQAGGGLNFEHPKSKLFFEFVRTLEEAKPQYFLLENVPMKKEWQDVISAYLGVEPIMIDSALVSAQRRKRLYWTNIPTGQPEDKGITLQDVLQVDVPEGGWAEVWDDTYATVRPPHRYREKCPTIRATRVGFEAVTFDSQGKLLERRSLTSVELERLQTLPDNYTLAPWGETKQGELRWTGKTKRWYLLGNGWTVDVIAHILAGVKL